ncbi:MAG: hypothetical protein ACLP2P_00615 [Desulfobaccales bacterium]
MDDKNGKNQLVPISLVFALCTALGVIIYAQVPLKGIRPSVPEIHERSQKINARLWQDPFQAVIDQAKTKDAEPSGVCKLHEPLLIELELLASEIKDHLQTENITVLGVMVSGTPYAEESRIRQRYAVLSGLHRLSYFPKDPEHINFIRIFQSKFDCDHAGSEISLSTILPYEWFVLENQKKHKESVLLLWINDDVFQEEPLAKLAIFSELLNQLRDQLRNQGNQNSLEFKVIGPAGSTTLHEMIKELQAATELQKLIRKLKIVPSGKLKSYAQLDGLEIYSAKATAEDSSLLREIKEDPEGRSMGPEKSNRIAEKFLDWGITFHQTICSDKELVQKLIKELRCRGVGKDDHIALISEWDTLYGRCLPETFMNVLKRRDFEGDESTETKVYRFSYLRGVDGKIPGERNGTAGERDGTAKEGQKTGGDRKEEEDLQEMEKPMGRSQYDYLRRLAERIYKLDQQLGQRRIKAIGVLGSDFHDKYLVLQALSQRFPERIFFTTDLDAGLLHPGSIKYTRNLVVASGFGLQLREDLQGDVPPFRDVYQTSIFLATLRAFRAFFSFDQLLQRTDPPKPRLFEIGKHNAIDLTEKEDNNGAEPPNDSQTVHPPRQMPELQAIPTIVITSIILLSLLFLWLLSNGVKRWVQGMGQLITRNPEILVLALVALMVFYKFILQDQSEEPFSLTEGVSVWPTNILRLIAIVLSWFFIFTSIGKLIKNDQQLGEEFRLGSGSNQPGTQESSWKFNLQTWWPTRTLKRICAWFNKFPAQILAFNQKLKETSLAEVVGRWLSNLYSEISCNREQNDRQSEVNVNQEWEKYIRKGYRLKPVFPLVICYVAICFLVIIFFGWPTTPVRGFWSYWITSIILLLTIFSFLTLTFFVFYTTRLCRRFVTRFCKKEPRWNLESLNRFRGRVGLKERQLSEWMLIRSIAKHTAVVGKLIYYPFIVWFIIVLSRLYYFDNWHAPIGLAIVIFMSALLVWYCAFTLRRAAEELRADVVERLELGTPRARPPSKEYAERVQTLRKEIISEQRGAFAPYLQNPVLHSFLALGGIGGLQLLGLLRQIT